MAAVLLEILKLGCPTWVEENVLVSGTSRYRRHGVLDECEASFTVEVVDPLI